MSTTTLAPAVRVKFNPVVFIVSFLLALAVAAAPSTPVTSISRVDWSLDSWNWLSPSEIRDKLHKEKEIFVRARDREERTEMQGQGIVRADCAKTFAEAIDFKNLKENAGILDSVHWNESEGMLALVFNVVGLRAPMKARLEFEDLSGGVKLMHAHVLEGYFKDLLATIRFEPTGDMGCMVEYRGWTSPENSISALSRLVVEQVMYRTAKRMRAHVEGKHQ